MQTIIHFIAWLCNPMTVLLRCQIRRTQRRVYSVSNYYNIRVMSLAKIVSMNAHGGRHLVFIRLIPRAAAFVGGRWSCQSPSSKYVLSRITAASAAVESLPVFAMNMHYRHPMNIHQRERRKCTPRYGQRERRSGVWHLRHLEVAIQWLWHQEKSKHTEGSTEVTTGIDLVYSSSGKVVASTERCNTCRDYMIILEWT